MARGPFQGTHVAGIRPTITSAPDAIVYINGNSDALTCPQCLKRWPINKYITSIQVDLSIDSVPGSATINLSIPRHAVDDFYFDGDPILAEMMEVEIFAKGYFLVEGVPQYYPIFWGLITEISDDYSGGETTVSIQCADILKWWELCKMAVNSAFTSPQPGERGMSMMGNVFFGDNPYDMIWTLAQQSFGDVVVGTGSLNNFIPEQGTQKQAFRSALNDIMLYWNERFTRMRSNLLLYGTQGVAVRGDTLYATSKGDKAQLKNLASSAVRLANGGPDAGQMIFDPTDPAVVAFKTQFQFDVPFWQSEYQTKLELANATKEAIGFEFYMDVDGSIVFKPPFFNLDIKDNKPVSWIQDIDVIDWAWSKSEAEVITQVQMQGSMQGNIEFGLGEVTTPLTTVTDYHLLRQYGWRTQTINSEFLGDPLKMYYHGMDILDRINSKRHRGSVTIPMRPEMRLGFPVYVASKDQIWYVNGISHNITFGGRAQTTLTLTARRRKFIAPRGTGTLKMTGIVGGKPFPTDPKRPKVRMSSQQLQQKGQFSLEVNDPAVIPSTTVQEPGQPSPYDSMILRNPKTGQIVGFPNAVMAYSRPMQAPDNVIRRNAGQTEKTPIKNKKDDSKRTQEGGKEVMAALRKVSNETDDVRIKERYITNRFSYGVNSAGAFVYARDTERVIQEILLLPAKNISVKAIEGTSNIIPKNSSALIRPISDDRGYELIGHFRYGRGVSLRDGRLIIRDGQPNEEARVTTQVAVSGDLYAMMSAQSQGITTITGQYDNPAEVLATLTMDDRQSAGFINPETGKPEWSDTGDHFVSTSPLGSPEQKGAEASVEASQLSRALTLAEMAVTSDENSVNDSSCPCLTGRAELAFMSSGYNVKIIDPATADPSGLGLFGTGTGTEANQSLPVQQDMNPGNHGSQLGKVDEFLFSLYSALDKPHQEVEKSLRGANLVQDSNSADDIRFGTLSPTQGDLSPPFSAPNRFAVGDPKAIAQQADSAINDIGERWDKFGEDLRRNTNTTQLSREISTDHANIARLRKQLENTGEASEKTRINQEIARLEQDIKNKEAELSQL